MKTLKIMKTINLLMAAFLIFTITGCEKMKKGVLEMREFVDYPYIGSNLVAFNESFTCIVVDEELIDFNAGEIKRYNVNGNTDHLGYTHVEYIYHADKSAKDLGYTKKMGGEMKTHYGTSDEYYYTEESGGIGLPAVNSGFGQIAGAWKYPATGETVWIDSDRNGTGKLIHGGSKFPKEAWGGIFFTEVQKTAQYTYKARNHTFYPGTGWVPASYLDFEMSKDGKTFKLGSAVWQRVN